MATLQAIVPAGVMAAEADGDDAPAPLFPEEQAALGAVADGRAREFATTRRCAQQALRRLGRPASPILRGPDREPLWPPAVVGSLTHCRGYRAAAVASAEQFRAIGIDAEAQRRLDPSLVARITDAGERRALAALPAGDTAWELLLFSAKESIYKAWFPLARRWLDFTDVSLRVDAQAETFCAELLVAPPLVAGRPLDRFHGRFAVDGARVVTFVGVPRTQEMR